MKDPVAVARAATVAGFDERREPAPPARGSPPRTQQLNELAGGLGDMGLFLPIAIAMITLNGLNATAVFVGVGLIYLLTALYFRVPVPVQPLKAFAAAAIALGLTASELAAGALLMSALMGVLAATGLADWLTRRFPLVLVRGIQAAVALLLVKAAVGLAERGNWEGLPEIAPELSFAVAIAAFVVLVAARRRAFPAALLVLAGGVGVGLVAGGAPATPALGPDPVGLTIPGGAAFATALTALVIVQIPLTFGNAVVATTDAAREYYGDSASRVTPNRLSASIAGGNLLGGLTGGMPICHGAGGVTAHYAMGARTALSTASAGLILIAAGLVFGGSLPALLMTLAPGVLAGMLAFVAFEHGLLAARLEANGDRAIAATVGAGTLLAGNLAIGFGAGVLLLGLRAALRSGPDAATAVR